MADVEMLEFQGRLQILEQELERLRMDMEDKEDQFLEVLPHIVPPHQQEEAVMKELFELYDLRDTTLKVRGYSGMVFIAGVAKTIGAGSAECDKDITISADTYIYVNVKVSDATATLEAAASVPAGDDDEERYPLWFIKWDGAKIDVLESVWLGRAIHVTGMAT